MALLLYFVLFICSTISSGHVMRNPSISTAPPPLNYQQPALYIQTPLCANKMDLVLAIDSSGSIKDIWNDMINDAQRLVAHFQVSDEITRMGIIDFSAISNVYTPLDSNNNIENSHHVLEEMRTRHQNGESWMELGFDRANDLFRSATPPRNDVRKVLVVYTDGDMTSGDRESLKDMLKSQRDGNVEHYVIKVRQNTTKDGLKIMMENHCRIFQMNEAPKMGKPSVEEAICYNSSGSAPPMEPHHTTPNKPGNAASKEFCMQSPANGPCFGNVPRFYYNSTLDKCMYFYYGGCGGNANNFGSAKDCEETCKGAKELLSIPATFSTTGPTVSTTSQTVSTTGPTVSTTAPTVSTTASTVSTPLNEWTTPTPYMQTTPSDPHPLTRCQTERNEAVSLIQSNVPTLVQIFVPECDESGKYKTVQHHEGTGNYWCVDPDSGELINGTKTENKLPPCATEGGGKPEPPVVLPNVTHGNNEPITACEKQRDGLIARASTAFKPECSLYDGLFLQVQRDSKRSFCVNRYTGDEIYGTSINNGEIPGIYAPECPEKSKCEKEEEDENAKNYHSLKLTGTYLPDATIPTCDKNGLYERIQVTFGYNWCVDIFTGEVINETRTPNGNWPSCPVNDLREECLLPKEVGPCRAAYNYYYFNTDTLSCDTFIYGGCNGNKNQFLSLEECQLRCGSLTRCKVDRAKAKQAKVIDPPKCDKGGDYKEVQCLQNGTKLCVDRFTGERVEGKAENDHRCEVIRTPKCKNDRDSRSSRLLGSYQPQCDDITGHYQTIQRYGSTGEAWCVHKYEGTEIVGSKMKPGENEPNCPVAKNEDCLLPKKGSASGIFSRYYYNWEMKRCVRFNYDGKNGNGNNFLTLDDCMIACHLQTSFPEGHSLTKAPPNLNTPVIEQKVTTTTTQPQVEQGATTTTTQPQVEQGATTTTTQPQIEQVTTTTTQPQVENTVLPVPPTPEPEGGPPTPKPEGGPPTPNPESGPPTPKPEGGPPTPEPEGGASTPKPEGGPPTPKPEGGPPTPKPEGGPPTPKPEGGPPTPKPEGGPPTPKPEGRPPTPEPEGGPDPYEKEERFYPTNKCGEENDFMKSRAIYNHDRNYDQFICENNGETYAPLQRNVHNNQNKWCVDSKTGKLVVGTLKLGDQPDPVCSGKPQPYFPEPETNPPQPLPEVPTSPLQPQNPGTKTPPPQPQTEAPYPGTETPQPQPEVPNPAIKAPPQPQPEVLVEDYFHPMENCSTENKFIKDKNARDHEQVYLFVCTGPQNELYFPQQASETEKWCVDSKSGHIIPGTKVPLNMNIDCKATDIFVEEPLTYVEHHESGVLTKTFSDQKYFPQGTCLDVKGKMDPRMIGAMTYDCEPTTGDYKPLQRHGSTGERWCVDVKSGRIIKEKHANGDQLDDPICDPTPGSQTNASSVSTGYKATNQIINGVGVPASGSSVSTGYKATNQMINGEGVPANGSSVSTGYKATNQMINGVGVPASGSSVSTGHKATNQMIDLDGTGTLTADEKFNPVGSCTEVSSRVNANAMGAMTYECDATTGNYKPLQRHGSTGETWCVDEVTGKLIPGKHANRGEKEPVCETGGATATSSNSTTMAHASDSTTMAYADEKFNPMGSCTEVRSRVNANAMGAMTYECDATTGNYKPLQRHGSTGEKWCVDEVSGQLIVGKYANRGQPDPVCETSIPTNKMSHSSNSADYENQQLTSSSHNASVPSAVNNKVTPIPMAPVHNKTMAYLTEKVSAEVAAQCQYRIGDNLKAGENLKKLGCYNDMLQPPRPFPVLLMNETVDVSDASQADYPNYLKAFVCKCAEMTRKRGWYSFGIQNKGEGKDLFDIECHSGPDEGRYAEDREAKNYMCVNENEQTCDKNDKKYCSGAARLDPVSEKTEHANFVYTIITQAHPGIQYIEYDRKKRHSLKKKHLHKRFIHQLKLKNTRFFKNTR